MGGVVIPDRGKAGEILNDRKPFVYRSEHSFKGKGIEGNCFYGQSTTISRLIPDGMTFDMPGVELINGQIGDKLEMKVIDVTGIYNENNTVEFELDQFGETWNVWPVAWAKQMPYASRLFEKMRVDFIYTNNGNEDRMIYINIDLHKIV